MLSASGLMIHTNVEHEKKNVSSIGGGTYQTNSRSGYHHGKCRSTSITCFHMLTGDNFVGSGRYIVADLWTRHLYLSFIKS
jgi:hypothetical protein